MTPVLAPSPAAASSAPSRPTRHTLAMSDGWTLPYTCYPAPRAQAVMVFVHGLGVDANVYSLLAMAIARSGVVVVVPSLRCDPDPRTGVIDLDDCERQTEDLVSLVDTLERDYPGLPVTVGAHSVGCSLVMRSLSRLEARVARVCLIAPVWAGLPDYARKNTPADRFIHVTRHLQWPTPQMGSLRHEAVSVGWSLLNMFAGRWWPHRHGGRPVVIERGGADATARRYSYRHFVSFHCADLEQRLLATRVPMFIALAQDDDYSLSSAVVSSLHWDRGVGTSRTVLVSHDADHVSILRSSLAPLLQWIRQWLAGLEQRHVA